MGHARLPVEEDGYPTIERDVYIYPGAILLGAISVGDGAKIIASAVVSKDVAPGAIVFGNPGRSSAGSRATARAPRREAPRTRATTGLSPPWHPQRPSTSAPGHRRILGQSLRR